MDCRGEAGGVDQLQEPGEISPLQGLALLDRPTVILVVMDGPEDCPVPTADPQGGDSGAEVGLRDLPQEPLVEVGRHGAHLPRNVSVVIGQVAMAGAGVHDAQGVAGPGKVILHLLD